MERFIRIFLVLAILFYFADKQFIHTLIYLIIGIEFVIMIVKEVKKKVSMHGQRKAY